MENLKLLSAFLFAYWTADTVVGSKLTVSSLNLWNVMFSWNVRKVRIAEMIHESKTDIIVFQEVRSDIDEKRNQVAELQELLPEFQWSVYRTADVVSKFPSGGLKGWEKEGLGLLSKYPVQDIVVQHLQYHKGPDTNKRIALHVKISIEKMKEINIVVVHFSYHRQQQCDNADSVLNFIQMKRLQNVIVLGDFNAYNDFQHPLDLFIERQTNNVCNKKLSITDMRFRDVWLERTKKPGFTFSNMPSPGIVSRPDRILISKKFYVEDVWLGGDGKHYKKYYRNSIIFSRFKVLVTSSYQNFKGDKSNTCLHDCGPKGSCRCGNCVKGDNRDCDDCAECSSKIFIDICLFFVFVFSCLCVMLFSILRILIIAARYNQEHIYSILGFRCCLFNSELHDFNLIPRRFRKLRRCPFVKVLNIPPLYLLALSFIVCLGFLFFGRLFFYASLENINNAMEEEFFISDHLMLSSRLFLS